MDSMDAYLRRLENPAVRLLNRKLRGIADDDAEPEEARVTEANLEAAERDLGVPLPPSYRKLVLSSQPYDVQYGVYWIWDGETDLYIPDIVSTKTSADEWLPPFLIPVVGVDGGDEFCLDTRRRDERGEYPVVYFDHEKYDASSTEFDTVASDLGELMLRALEGNKYRL